MGEKMMNGGALKTRTQRCLRIALAFLLVFTLLPTAAFAEINTQTADQEQPATEITQNITDEDKASDTEESNNPSLSEENTDQSSKVEQVTTPDAEQNDASSEDSLAAISDEASVSEDSDDTISAQAAQEDEAQLTWLEMSSSLSDGFTFTAGGFLCPSSPAGVAGDFLWTETQMNLPPVLSGMKPATDAVALDAGEYEAAYGIGMHQGNNICPSISRNGLGEITKYSWAQPGNASWSVQVPVKNETDGVAILKDYGNGKTELEPVNVKPENGFVTFDAIPSTVSYEEGGKLARGFNNGARGIAGGTDEVPSLSIVVVADMYKPETKTLEPGTYTITSNLAMPGQYNPVIAGVTVYANNPNNPFSDKNGKSPVLDGNDPQMVSGSIPTSPLSSNATLVVSEDGTKTLILPIMNPAFTTQELGTCEDLDDIKISRCAPNDPNVWNYGKKETRINKIAVTLTDDQVQGTAKYTFKDSCLYAVPLEGTGKETIKPTGDIALELSVEYDTIQKTSDSTEIDWPTNEDPEPSWYEMTSALDDNFTFTAGGYVFSSESATGVAGDYLWTETQLGGNPLKQNWISLEVTSLDAGEYKAAYGIGMWNKPFGMSFVYPLVSYYNGTDTVKSYSWAEPGNASWTVSVPVESDYDGVAILKDYGNGQTELEPVNVEPKDGVVTFDAIPTTASKEEGGKLARGFNNGARGIAGGTDGVPSLSIVVVADMYKPDPEPQPQPEPSDKLEPGTYTITANLFVPDTENDILHRTAYMTNPKNPMVDQNDQNYGLPLDPVADNAKLVVTEDGRYLLDLTLPNPVFTLIDFGTAEGGAKVLGIERDGKTYGANTGGRITRAVIELPTDNQEGMAFIKSHIYAGPLQIDKTWSVSLATDVANAKKVSSNTDIVIPEQGGSGSTENPGTTTEDPSDPGTNPGTNPLPGLDQDTTSGTNTGTSSSSSNAAAHPTTNTTATKLAQGTYKVSCNIWFDKATTGLPLNPHITSGVFPPKDPVANNATLRVDANGRCVVTIPIPIQHKVMKVNSISGLNIIDSSYSDGALSSITVDLGVLSPQNNVVRKNCTVSITMGDLAGTISGITGQKTWSATFQLNFSGLPASGGGTIPAAALAAMSGSEGVSDADEAALAALEALDEDGVAISESSTPMASSAEGVLASNPWLPVLITLLCAVVAASAIVIGRKRYLARAAARDTHDSTIR